MVKVKTVLGYGIVGLVVVGSIMFLTSNTDKALTHANILSWLKGNPTMDYLIVYNTNRTTVDVVAREQFSNYSRLRAQALDVCQFEGKNQRACYRWIVSERRKSVNVSATQQDDKVIVVKRSAYKSGTIIEMIVIAHDGSHYSVESNLKERLVMEVSKMRTLDEPFALDFGMSTVACFGDDFTFCFRWNGMNDAFDYHEFDGTKLRLYFRQGLQRLG